MKMKQTNYQMDHRKAEQIIEKYMKRFDNCTRDTRRFHFLNISQYLSYMRSGCKKGTSIWVFTEATIMKWMKVIASEIVFHSTALVFQSINRYLEFLVDYGALSVNPMQAINNYYSKCGWTAFARILHSKKPDTLLRNLVKDSPFKGHFGKHSQTFLKLKQISGVRCRHVEKALLEFNRFLNSRSIVYKQAVTSETIYQWVCITSGRQNYKREKALALRQFFEYLVTLGIIKCNPVNQIILDSIGPHRYSFRPYIFSVKEIDLILKHAKLMPSNFRFRLKPQTIHVIIVLLYTLGLRIGEVCRLQMGDVDIKQKTLLVRNSKFYKDRIIPFGPKLVKCLEEYIKLRQKYFGPAIKTAPFFIAKNSKAVHHATIRKAFVELLNCTGIRENLYPDQPSIHCLRHTFAVHRLLQWYEEEKDIQSKLILLSTFMGHINIYSSQVYLTITDELLKKANIRFYSKFNDVL